MTVYERIGSGTQLNLQAETARAIAAEAALASKANTLLLAPAPSGDTTGATDTAAIQTLLNATSSNGGGGVILQGASEAAPYWITNLTLKAKCVFSGVLGGGYGTWIKRPSSATGDTIREKTSGEGNASGATGIVVSNIALDGNGSAGNGFNLGNQGTATFNFLARAENLFAQNFPTGAGIIIKGNAISCSYLWSNSNQDGIVISGGSNKLRSLWAESNSRYDLDSSSIADIIFGIHVEPRTPSGTSTDPSVRIGDCTIIGLTFSQQQDRTRLITIRAGATRFALYSVRLLGNGHASTDFVYSDGLTAQMVASNSGSTSFLPFVLDDNNTSPAMLVDTTNNKKVLLGGYDGIRLASVTTAGRPTAANAGAGSQIFDTTLGAPIWSDGTNWFPTAAQRATLLADLATEVMARIVPKAQLRIGGLTSIPFCTPGTSTYNPVNGRFVPFTPQQSFTIDGIGPECTTLGDATSQTQATVRITLYASTGDNPSVPGVVLRDFGRTPALAATGITVVDLTGSTYRFVAGTQYWLWLGVQRVDNATTAFGTAPTLRMINQLITLEAPTTVLAQSSTALNSFATDYGLSSTSTPATDTNPGDNPTITTTFGTAGVIRPYFRVSAIG